ncbi:MULTISPECIES: MarR family winged helix-turn-helix transcriptional regulator [Carnobacterium]|uniref:MarR family transcriptional regulator n=1 Tax=Carnobacterium divergens TaxID=2748 RepID=A0A2R7ZUA6_CARDV|nr:MULTISPECIES: helix-turn-helix domain-containing protein [Carnobacterium]MCO6018739.1 MarR family winged helix-turn-helix transcriptional regulator [Carnobacterium divergens]MDT1939660.1 MarR family winged helix-turn-helix transcriptional regulator [Carnobacterium divergens]MDT1942098.1 MarR family winged helix-turn-helix transcriptional regulator [Carnobacterium divergens]MDT1947896.1 MarR family winged helix-turn-helix transcriptional regulator [Carnobacterium divergens]MDT1950384.1 MarR 
MDQESINFDKNLALFYFAYRAFSKTADDLVENYGISKVHRRILFFVARMPGLTVNELLTVLDISKQALNKPMQELLQKEWLVTKPNEADKRSKRIYLTAQGKNIDAQISEAQKEKMKTIFQQTGDPTGEAWTNVMTEYAKETGTDFIERIT